MQLSYLVSPFENSFRKTVKASITTGHSMSSYGQPVIVLEDGGAIDLMSWVGGWGRFNGKDSKMRM